jgi:Zn-dependent M28 family amino/carboxypeptidase
MVRVGRIGMRAAAAIGTAIVAVAASLAAQDRTLRRVDPATLLADLGTLAADDMQGRELGTPGGAKARAFIVSRFRALGLQPVGASFEHPFEAQPGRVRGGTPSRGANVVGLIAGTRRPDRYIVVSAHYDHIGVRGGVVFNGANDNASGTAALFAIARHFSAHPPATSLLLVAFDGEEAGLVGSRAFVRAPPVPLDAIVVDLNADMIGRDAAKVLYVTGTRLPPQLRPIVERVAARATVTVRIGHDGAGGPGAEDWTRDSDQFAFIEAGVPALYIGVEDYAHHHRATDDAESIDPAFYAGVVETLIDAVAEFDASAETLAPARPRPN